MGDFCVVVVSEARARFFTLQPVEYPELESGPRLVERDEVVNAERREREGERYADSKTGRGRNPGGARAHGYDDHRDRHEDEFDRRFAKDVLEKTSKMIQSDRVRKVVLVAPKRMLGFLRQEMDMIQGPGVEVDKVAKDMIRFTPEQIHEHLAKGNLLPAKSKAGSRP